MKFPRILPAVVMALAPAFSAMPADATPTQEQIEKKQLEERGPGDQPDPSVEP